MLFRWSPSSQTPLAAGRPQLWLCQCQLHRCKSPLVIVLPPSPLPSCFCWSHSCAIRDPTSCLLLLTVFSTRPSMGYDAFVTHSDQSFSGYRAQYRIISMHVSSTCRLWGVILSHQLQKILQEPVSWEHQSSWLTQKLFCKATSHDNWALYNTADPFIYRQI